MWHRPLVAQLFERDAEGDVSLKEVTRIAGEIRSDPPKFKPSPGEVRGSSDLAKPNLRWRVPLKGEALKGAPRTDHLDEPIRAGSEVFEGRIVPRCVRAR